MRFDATSSAIANGLVALSAGPQTQFDGFAVLVGFSADGLFTARNGDVYQAISPLPYQAGVSYRFRLLVDVTAKRYSAFVMAPGGSEQLLARDYSFRTTQLGVSALDNWATWVKAGPPSTLNVCNFEAAARVCSAVPSTGTFANQPHPVQSGTFTAEFDATPSASPMDTVMAFSKGKQALHDDFAVLARFGRSGMVEARNGGVYAAVEPIPYAAGTTYHFRFVIDVAAHIYSAYVTAPGQPERTLASGYAFRLSQGGVTSLDHFGTWVNATTPGQNQICGLNVGGQATPPPPPPPPPPADTPVAINGQLHVCGKQLCNQDEQPIQLRGMSTHGLQWYGRSASTTPRSTRWPPTGRPTSCAISHVHPGGRLRDRPAPVHRPGAIASSSRPARRGMYAHRRLAHARPGRPELQPGPRQDLLHRRSPSGTPARPTSSTRSPTSRTA